MDRWHKSLREDRFCQERKIPSFSSTLLDAIYRSIDEDEGGEEELVFNREAMRKKQSIATDSNVRGSSFLQEDRASLRRACMIEKWMEKKVTEKVVFRRKSTPDLDPKLPNDRKSVLLNSTSCSSDSSSAGGFSSSEAESVYGARSRSSGFTAQRPKPVRTCIPAWSEKPLQYYGHQEQRKLHAFDEANLRHHQERDSLPQQKPSKNEGGRFIRTKSRALKIYGDLKKVKQPISPGGRLAAFLNSLFTAGNAKKAKISSSACGGGMEDTCSERISKSAQASTCSSASSFSRSCLSKTPSSGGKLSNGMKRSVRFYPVSVIVDEDCRPCGHKCLYEDDPGLIVRQMAEPRLMNEDLKFHLMEKNRRVEQAARDILSSYQQKKSGFDIRDAEIDVCDEEDDEGDDAASYSSSDLFELDNLAVIGIDRYREELPVYETTHLGTNRAIASGLIL
ncbi:PREDICTED: protein BIG GRAIN 1-like B [Nelumbo nucifera]|uniref:Protein BIG GRAIN 1-like B n=2 Tax=Nelumbo nucifera TaxID=4432 RepID=A0A822ZX53_NELNU|nr:PREDICTED: protein BIG GRAIN 1-like B [Nelumbo nucifera]DAD49080.1 TPA_asm: hypothetical protein HUJ06_019017 [Nelumbo nucifera]